MHHQKKIFHRYVFPTVTGEMQKNHPHNLWTDKMCLTSLILNWNHSWNAMLSHEAKMVLIGKSKISIIFKKTD